MELEKGQNNEYWRDMTVVVEDELRKLKQDESGDGQGGSDSRQSSANISNSVLKSVADTLKSKTYAQLAALERQVSDAFSCAHYTPCNSPLNSLLPQSCLFKHKIN